MIVLSVFVAYLGACLLLAAALFYPVHQFLSLVADPEPGRLLYRFAMLLALLGLWPLLQRLRLADRAALGLAGSGRDLRRALLRGFLCGVAILAVLSAALILAEVRVYRPWDADLARGMAKVAVTALASGLLIGSIEEVFFRGALYEGVRRSRGVVVAILASTLLYAALHFVRPPAPPPELGWTSGFELLAGAFWRYGDFPAIADSFLALVVVGVFLALVRWRTGGIATAIGLHAGWVYVIMLTKRATHFDPQAPAAALVGSYDHVIGWLATAWLLVVGLLYWRFGPARRASTSARLQPWQRHRPAAPRSDHP